MCLLLRRTAAAATFCRPDARSRRTWDRAGIVQGRYGFSELFHRRQDRGGRGKYGSTIRQCVVPRSNAPLPDRKGVSRGIQALSTPTALLLLPLARLQPLDALRVLTGVSVLCLICSIILLAEILSWRLVESTVFVLLSGYAVTGALRLGQPYILVSLSCILGYYARLKGRPLLAGICFGLFTPIKYLPVVFLVLLCISQGVEGWCLAERPRF